MSFFKQYKVLIILVLLVLAPLLTSEFFIWKAIDDQRHCSTPQVVVKTVVVTPTVAPTATPSALLKSKTLVSPTKVIVKPIIPTASSSAK